MIFRVLNKRILQNPVFVQGSFFVAEDQLMHNILMYEKVKGDNFEMDVIKELQNSDFFIKPLPKDITVAMAYLPYQNAVKLYSPEHGIQQGTMFPELNKPFKAYGRYGGKKDE